MAFDRINPWQVQAFDQGRWIIRRLKHRAAPEKRRIEANVDPRFRRQAIRKLRKEKVDQNKVAAGVCYALSLDWLSKKLKQHGSVMDKLSRRDKTQMVDKALGRQARVMDISDHEWDQADLHGRTKRPVVERYATASGGMAGRMRLEEVGLVESWQAVDKDILANAIRRCLRQGLLMGYNFWQPVIQRNGSVTHSSGGHAVAWYLSRGTWGWGLWNQHVYLFDPNCGEYRLKLSELDGFVEKFLDDTKEAWGATESGGTHHNARFRNFGLTAYRMAKSPLVKKKDEKKIMDGLRKAAAFPGRGK